MSKHRLLIVDDEVEVVNALKRYLMLDDDMDIFSCTKPEEALDIIKKEKINVMLTDINMPKLDGADLVHQVRDWSLAVQIIIMTAGASLDRALKCVEGGASDCLIKPFDGEILRKVVGQAYKRYERILMLITQHMGAEGREEY